MSLINKVLECIKRPEYILFWLDNKRIITLDDEKYIKLLYELKVKKKLNQKKRVKQQLKIKKNKMTQNKQNKKLMSLLRKEKKKLLSRIR